MQKDITNTSLLEKTKLPNYFCPPYTALTDVQVLIFR